MILNNKPIRTDVENLYLKEMVEEDNFALTEGLDIVEDLLPDEIENSLFSGDEDDIFGDELDYEEDEDLDYLIGE